MLFGYGQLMGGLQPLMRAKLMRRGLREPGYRESIDERFGHYRQPRGSGYVWLHAVSLGEARAAAVLLAELRRIHPALRVLLTHGTATGRAQGQSLLQTVPEGGEPADVQVWVPWDTPAAVQRFLDHFQPVLGVLLETEVWPCMARACAVHQVPLVLVNARMNPVSFARALQWRWLSRPAYAALSGVWAQTPDDALRLQQLGAPVLGVTGNLKFDAEPDARQIEWARQLKARWTRPVVLLASSREGEEALWLEALGQLAAADGAAVQWLVVPRHPQRFEEVAGMVEAAGLTCLRRTEWAALDSSSPGTVWLGNTMGEMSFYGALADLALLGGSFAPLGGQNLIELAACGCPVLLGPHTFNFQEVAVQAILADAALRVDSMHDAVAAALALSGQPDQRRSMSQRALEFAKAHRGAALQTARALSRYLCQPQLGPK
jgi:3-deoxy-D-manno-octulosonic-acid transferase